MVPAYAVKFSCGAINQPVTVPYQPSSVKKNVSQSVKKKPARHVTTTHRNQPNRQRKRKKKPHLLTPRRKLRQVVAVVIPEPVVGATAEAVTEVATAVEPRHHPRALSSDPITL